MGLRTWWRAKREADKALAADLALNTDQRVIADQVPELLGMSDVEGMAHVLSAIDEWNGYASQEEALELHRRLTQSQDSFTVQGRRMPYWGNLWVLRNYQRELGIAAPVVAPRQG